MSVVLDIGCGAHKQPGTVSIDLCWLPVVKVVYDFERGLPFKDGSIAAAYSIHFLEHMRDVIPSIVSLYRVCMPRVRVTVKRPYYAS